MLRIGCAGALLLVVTTGLLQDGRDVAVVKTALQAVANQEFSRVENSRRTVTIATRSMAVSETALRQLALHGAQEQWPPAAVDRVRDANRQPLRFGKITLAGIEVVNGNATATLEASVPAYVDREAYVFVRIKMLAIHLWVVRLLQQDDMWRVEAAVLIAAS